MTDKKHDQPLSKPDPETLHTTDPQEHMEGPISSAMQGIKETAEESDVKSGRIEKDSSSTEEDTDDRDDRQQ